MPAISNKVADIPPDDYSWRKYGQKPIKGSPYPRYTLLDHSLLIDELMVEERKNKQRLISVAKDHLFIRV